MRGGPLLSPEELHAVLNRVTLLDVRYRMGGPPGRAQYRDGHIPGAAYVDLDSELAAPAGRGGRHPLPDPDAFAAAMRRAGVSADRLVVVYDDWSGRAAARAWWLLRFHGHPAVRLLDGGWSAWRAAGGAVATGNESSGGQDGGGGDWGGGDGGGGTTRPGSFSARPGGMACVHADAVPGVAVLVDARAPERYRGELEPIDKVAGHIPGAVNVPTDRNLTSDGRFRNPRELAATYAAVGAVPGADVAAYCGSGVTAAHDVLALELAGVAAALYPGSWSEWTDDLARPVATGD